MTFATHYKRLVAKLICPKSMKRSLSIEQEGEHRLESMRRGLGTISSKTHAGRDTTFSRTSALHDLGGGG